MAVRLQEGYKNTMNELWNVLLSSGMTLEQIESCRYVLAETGSPYFEVQTLSDGILTVNPYLRFAGLFQMLMEQEQFKHSEEGQMLFHTFMELIFEIERYGGYDKAAFQKEILQEEIKRGYFGKEVADRFFRLTDCQQSRTLENLIVMHSTNAGIESFVQEMQDIFPNCMVFKHKDQEKQLYIYMGEEKNQSNTEQIDLIQKLFLPMDCKCGITWEYPYALLNTEKVQLLGEQYTLY